MRHRKGNFKFGERVNAISLQGKKVFGQYRGMRGSFGAFVLGIEEGSFEPPSMHIVNTLTMERAPKEQPKKQKKLKLRAGDQCTGLTKEGEKVVGSYMNSEGTYAWIRGAKATMENQELRSAFKVLTNTLQKV